MTIAIDILIGLSVTVVLIIVDAFFIWLSVDKILKYSYRKSDRGFKTALKIAFFVGIVNFVLGMLLMYMTDFSGKSIIAWIFFVAPWAFMLFLIQKIYQFEWERAFVVWLVIVAGEAIVGFIAGSLISLVLSA